MSHRGGARIGCTDFRRQLTSDRRSFLKAGVLGATGLSLASLLRHEAAAGPAASSGRPSVIILWMRGGPSHIDMWDPKPDAPAEFRGEFGVRPTNVPGILLTDLLPMCGRIMDKWSIVRSLHHNDAGHSTGDQICFTGYPSGPNGDENIYPSCGSIVSKQLGGQNPRLPAYVMIPRMVPGTGPAYLGVAHKPFETQADPANPGPFRLPNFSLPDGVTLERRRRPPRPAGRLRPPAPRRGRDRPDGGAGRIQGAGVGHPDFAGGARRLRPRPRAGRGARALRLPAGVRPRRVEPLRRPGVEPAHLAGAAAGGGGRAAGDGGPALVGHARQGLRVAAAGLPAALRPGLLGADRGPGAARPAFIDIGDRLGRIWPDAEGEQRRRPRPLSQRLQRRSGRRAGEGRPRGRLRDAKGAFPKANPKTPQDVLATMYHHLGVDTAAQYPNGTGRPITVLPEGKAIAELF